MDVCLYMRYSSDKQNEQSIEGQRRVCQEFCGRMGYTIVRTYIDRATSAFKDTDKREDFQRMIRDSASGMWQAVIVYKLDRFARNRYDSATYKAKLKKNGCRVISATENISDNPEGIILESVLEGMAEFYSRELSQKITRGMHESALKGYNLGGRIPLGYKLEDHKLVIDDEKAPIVRKVFEMYADGSSFTEISDYCNNQGYRTTNGAKFNKNSYHAMLKNERYIGVYKFRDMRVEDGIPPIIDKSLFDRVQSMLESKTNKHHRSSPVDFLLTSKIFCGHCGSAMIGESGTSKSGKKHYYYTCKTKKHSHTCNKTPLRKDRIERMVVEDVCKLLTPDVIDILAESAVAQNNRDISENTSIPVISRQIKDLQRSIDNLLRLVEKGADSDSLFHRLNDLEQEKKSAERRLAEAKDDVIVLEKDHVVFWLTKFLTGDIEDPDFRRSIIDMLVNSVTVYDETDDNGDKCWRIVSVYNLIPQKTSTFRCSTVDSYSPPIENQSNTYIVGTYLILVNRHRV